MKSRPSLLALCLLAGCGGQMSDQPRYEPLEASAFFVDGRSARPRVAGTVARGDLGDELLLRGTVNGRLVDLFPLLPTPGLLAAGGTRYAQYCSVCHGLSGHGDGMVVQRGFPAPPSLHSERLRRAPAGQLFAAMSSGLGRMYGYADRISVHDRWAIAAYLRALQLSQNAPVARLTAAEREKLR